MQSSHKSSSCGGFKTLLANTVSYLLVNFLYSIIKINAKNENHTVCEVLLSTPASSLPIFNAESRKTGLHQEKRRFSETACEHKDRCSFCNMYTHMTPNTKLKYILYKYIYTVEYNTSHE